jgi:chemotaxis-related protein WspD
MIPGAPQSVINDCWNKIGVRGDASCLELEQHVHCRNCPIYSAAAVDLLDGELPIGYSASWTNYFAQERQVELSNQHSVVIFRMGAEWLALPTSIFKEVAELRTIHSLPHRRGSIVHGLVNVRGELLVCVCLDNVLGLEHRVETKPEKNRTVHRRLLVVSREGDRLVFPVDEVHGIQRFHEQELREVPATVARATATYTKAVLSWQTKSVGVLDDELLFYTLSRGLA